MSIAVVVAWVALIAVTWWICGKPLRPAKPEPPRAPVIIRTRPEKPAFNVMKLTARQNVTNADEAMLRTQYRTVRLAYMLGCDLAMARDGTRNEWLMPGDEPSARHGFLLVRNGDA